MENLKLKVVIGDINIELEGEGELVHTLFNEMRENGLGQLTYIMPIIKERSEKMSDANKADDEDINEAKDTEVDIPSLKNITLQNIPKTEKEWLIVYALYCSQNEKKTFTQKDLLDKYVESNRYTETRRKNLVTNIKRLASDKHIEAVNSTDFRITQEGRILAWSIINNDQPKVQKVKKNGIQIKSKKSSTTYEIINLGLEESEREAFRAFWISHPHTSNMNKVSLIAYWLKEHKGISQIGANEVFTMLRTVNENTSFNIESAMNNAKNQKNYLTQGDQPGYYKINHIGEDAIRLQQKE